MPAGYEHMRDSFKREGMSDKDAKAKAARIWNSKHPNNPVTGKHHKKHRTGHGDFSSIIRKKK